MDVTPREKEVLERLEKAHPMSRTSSRTASERSPLNRTMTPPPATHTPTSPKLSSPTLAPTVRPTLSFANVAAKRDEVKVEKDEKTEVSDVTEKVADVTI